METKWYLLSQEQIFEKLHTSLHGLTPSDVQDKIKQYGFNILPEKKPTSLIRLFFNQFNSPLILILLLASVITYIIGGTTDAYIILAVLLFNAIVGTIQEGKAQNTLLALRKFVETKATVLRDDKEIIIPDAEIVLGDILILQEGERVPADARIILSHSLKIDEAALTGESEPKHKISEAEQNSGEGTFQYKNIVYKGTTIVAGNGRAIVIATGQETIIGSIAKKISVIDTEIPLKNNI